MKRLMVLAAVATATVAMFAQSRPQRQGEGQHQGERRQMMPFAGPWMMRMLSSKESLEKIGVTDEALQKKVLDGLASLRGKEEELDRKVREMSRDQFQQMRTLFEDGGNDPKAVYSVIDELAKLRGEQGKLTVKAILVLRENLSKEQFAKVRSMLFERGRDRGMMRRSGRGGTKGDRPGRQPRDGKGGRGTTPPPET